MEPINLIDLVTINDSLPTHLGDITILALAFGQGPDSHLATVMVKRAINIGLRQDLASTIPTTEYIVWTVNLQTKGCSGGIYIPCTPAQQTKCLEKAWKEFSLRAKCRMDIGIHQEA